MKKKVINVILALVFFILLIGSAFAISTLFGLFFVAGFLISVYKGDLKKKPLKPIAIFVGALIIRFALDRFLAPVLESETIIDLGVAAFIFLFVFLIGWKVRKS